MVVETLLAALLSSFPTPRPDSASAPALHAAALTASAWTRGSFASSDGARLGYEYRAGAGDPVLLVHGLGLGAASFAAWGSLFPGRPLMVLERRGYGAPAGDVDESDIGPANVADVSAAVDDARRLSGGARVGLVGYSWGALALPAPDPARMAWVAYVCPGVPGMSRYLPASEQALEAQTRYWHAMARAGGPVALSSWLAEVIEPGVLQLAAKARSLGMGAAADALTRRASDPAFLELYTDESLWAYAQDGAPPPARGVPVFVGYAEGDLVVPPASVRARVGALRAAGAS
ncbi:MAG: alpha/beta hydrolase, partial [Elusimicrobia bacterium]|nr:alpha/beta hydrolase [Elusimicrobiota bacterium]